MIPIPTQVPGWMKSAGEWLLIFALAAAIAVCGYITGDSRATRACLEQRIQDTTATVETLQALQLGVDDIERSLLRQAEAQKKRQLQLQKEFSDYANRSPDVECLDADGLRLWRDAIRGHAEPTDGSDGAVPGAGATPLGDAQRPPGGPPPQHGHPSPVPRTPSRAAGLRVQYPADDSGLSALTSETRIERHWRPL